MDLVSNRCGMGFMGSQRNNSIKYWRTNRIMSTKDLYALAVENGMTDEEFVKEVRECFATHMSLILDWVEHGMESG